ncbi:MAG: 30S ribosomal protein S6 [Candidatus Sumerlaeia bacterium]|nr:30S ribosomal protein S6 [Candidatus Sumerlaeia bacterium]
MPQCAYECVVVVDPTKTEQDITTLHDRIADTITTNGGQVTTRDVWGRRRLAYEINRRREGHYTVFHFDGPSSGQLLPELKRLLRLDESILRFLVVRAVVGKSKGDPALAERIQAQMSAPRYGGNRRPSGPPRGEDAAAAAEAPAAEAAPAEAAPATE